MQLNSRLKVELSLLARRTNESGRQNTTANEVVDLILSRAEFVSEFSR